MVVFYHMTENEVKNYGNFHLSIEINAQFIHFLLIDKSNKKGVAIETIPLDKKDLSTAFNESEIVQKSALDTVSCVFQNSAFTLVPNSIFQENKSLTYLEFNQTSLESFEINHEIRNCIFNHGYIDFLVHLIDYDFHIFCFYA